MLVTRLLQYRHCSRLTFLVSNFFTVCEESPDSSNLRLERCDKFCGLDVDGVSRVSGESGGFGDKSDLELLKVRGEIDRSDFVRVEVCMTFLFLFSCTLKEDDVLIGATGKGDFCRIGVTNFFVLEDLPTGLIVLELLVPDDDSLEDDLLEEVGRSCLSRCIRTIGSILDFFAKLSLLQAPPTRVKVKVVGVSNFAGVGIPKDCVRIFSACGVLSRKAFQVERKTLGDSGMFLTTFTSCRHTPSRNFLFTINSFSFLCTSSSVPCITQVFWGEGFRAKAPHSVLVISSILRMLTACRLGDLESGLVSKSSSNCLGNLSSQNINVVSLS